MKISSLDKIWAHLVQVDRMFLVEIYWDRKTLTGLVHTITLEEIQALITSTSM